MKKTYEQVEMALQLFSEEDVIRTSQNDNVIDVPEFPEDFQN